MSPLPTSCIWPSEGLRDNFFKKSKKRVYKNSVMYSYLLKARITSNEKEG